MMAGTNLVEKALKSISVVTISITSRPVVPSTNNLLKRTTGILWMGLACIMGAMIRMDKLEAE